MKKIIHTFIPDKELRKRIKISILSAFPFLKKEKKMKLGVSYSVWDGEELLEASIKSIREHSDYINVVWQKVSWFGESCDENLENLLLSLKEKGLIDEIIYFEPNLKLSPNINEINKRNLGLKGVQKANCSHFLIMDTDEFYKPEEFKAAKEHILYYDITHSICNQYMYPHINCRESSVAGFFAFFIHKINQHTKLVMNACSPVPWLVDPTKQIPITKKSKFCFMNNIAMHHYGGVRKDITKKYRNSSVNLAKEDQISLTEWANSDMERKIAQGECVKAKNIFNIEI